MEYLYAEIHQEFKIGDWFAINQDSKLTKIEPQDVINAKFGIKTTKYRNIHDGVWKIIKINGIKLSYNCENEVRIKQ